MIRKHYYQALLTQIRIFLSFANFRSRISERVCVPPLVDSSNRLSARPSVYTFVKYEMNTRESWQKSIILGMIQSRLRANCQKASDNMNNCRLVWFSSSKRIGFQDHFPVTFLLRLRKCHFLFGISPFKKMRGSHFSNCFQRCLFFAASLPDVFLCVAIFSLSASFLDAPSHLYKRSCPSVRPSVRRSVRPALFSDAY